jgi:hypothetical protein
MSLIKDIKKEVNELDLSPMALHKGGVTLGLAIVIAGVLLYFFSSYKMTGIYTGVIGIVLILVSFFAPVKIKGVYKIWMTFALILGWFVSKIIFTIIFYLVVTPIGFIAKLVGKEFLDLNFSKKVDSYWVRKSDRKIDYEKMH